MALDITIHKGRADKPVVIFVHGLGTDKSIWISPLETKIFAKNIPLKYFAAIRPKATSKLQKGKITTGEIPDSVDSLWPILKSKGYNLVCWTQSRPVGPINAAVNDLKKIMLQVKKVFPEKPVALIGHSRGGLIARKYMELKSPQIKALITIASPHDGSSLSKIGKYLPFLSGVISNILPRETHGTISNILKRIIDLVDGNALKELMPGAEFFKHLKDTRSEKIHYLSFGGLQTEILNIYKWEKRGTGFYPKKLLTIPDSLLKFVPALAVPDEITSGEGDIMVTADSSVLPWASEHYNVKANHFTILWDRKVIKKTLEVLQKI